MIRTTCFVAAVAGLLLLLGCFQGQRGRTTESSSAAAITQESVAQRAIDAFDRDERIEWVTFLMEELSKKRPTETGGSSGDFEVGLLLEIAHNSTRVLELAAEQHLGFSDRDLKMSAALSLDMISQLHIDSEPGSRDGTRHVGSLLTLQDGRLDFIVSDRLPPMGGPPIAPFTEIDHGVSNVQGSKNRLGLRDLSVFDSQHLTPAQRGELYGMFLEWDGDFVVPDEPALLTEGRPIVGTVRSIERDLPFSALSAAGIDAYGRAERGTTLINTRVVDRERARNIVRADALENGYAFLEGELSQLDSNALP